MDKVIDFSGIKVGAVTVDKMVEKILEYVFVGKGKFITYLNVHCVNISFSDFEYKKVLQRADLVYIGGQGVVWAVRFLGSPIPERVNILDFFDLLFRKLIDNNIKIKNT